VGFSFRCRLFAHLHAENDPEQERERRFNSYQTVQRGFPEEKTSKVKTRPWPFARAVKSGKGIKSRKIDYSDIPELSDRQFSAMRRVGRPMVGDELRKLIVIRLDAKVLGWLRKAAKKRAALSITRQRDFGQRDEKGELGLSDAK